jgi:uncharacterized protein YegP (UPF0339 family)
MVTAKIQQTEDGEYFVSYVSPNGKTIAHSECLKSKKNAFKNIRAMMGDIEWVNIKDLTI